VTKTVATNKVSENIFLPLDQLEAKFITFAN